MKVLIKKLYVLSITYIIYYLIYYNSNDIIYIILS